MKLKLSIFERAGKRGDYYIHVHGESDSLYYDNGKDVTCWADTDKDYVRICDPFTIDVVTRDEDALLKQHCEGLDEKISTTRAEAERRVNILLQAKRDLMQIEYIPAGEE